jgi:transposase
MSHTVVCKTLRNHKKEGKSGLSGKARCRKLGEARHLSADQEDRFRGKIIDRRLEQLKMNFALWMRESVRKLILQNCKISMPIRTVGEYLRRWGFTPQRPVKFASERQPRKMKEWMEKYPRIFAIEQPKRKPKSIGTTRQGYVLAMSVAEAMRHEESRQW